MSSTYTNVSQYNLRVVMAPNCQFGVFKEWYCVNRYFRFFVLVVKFMVFKNCIRRLSLLEFIKLVNMPLMFKLIEHWLLAKFANIWIIIWIKCTIGWFISFNILLSPISQTIKVNIFNSSWAFTQRKQRISISFQVVKTYPTLPLTNFCLYFLCMCYIHSFCFLSIKWNSHCSRYISSFLSTMNNVFEHNFCFANLNTVSYLKFHLFTIC